MQFNPTVIGRTARQLPAILVLATLPATGTAAQVARRIVSESGEPMLYPSYLTECDGRLYFRANNLPHGNNVELWVFDGAAARLAAEINPGPTGSDPSCLAAYGGKLYFCANPGTGSNKLWCYDPVNGASLAPGSATNASLPQDLFAYGGNLYFRAARFGTPSNIGVELWRFDGTAQTPLDMFAGTGSSYPQHFIEYGGLMYFNACGTPNQGTELWRHNGAGMPTEAARIYPNNGSSPENFAVYDGQLYFSAYDGVHGRELWRFNGTSASLAADIVPGGQYSSSNPSGLTVFNGKLYFSATDALHGCELWSFDGTTARLVLDVNPGQYGSEPNELTIYQESLYFSADDGYVPGLNTLEPQVFALAAVAPTSLLRLSPPLMLAGNQLRLVLERTGGTPLTADDLARIKVYASGDLAEPPDQWQLLTNPPVLRDGAAEMTGIDASGPRRFFRAVITE